MTQPINTPPERVKRLMERFFDGATSNAEERELAEEFRSRAGSIVCRELLAARANRAEGVRGMSCPELVALAAEIAEERIFAPLRSDNDR